MANSIISADGTAGSDEGASTGNAGIAPELAHARALATGPRATRAPSSARVPDFSSVPDAGPPAPAVPEPRTGGMSRRAGSRPLHVRLALPLDARYRQLLRDCEDDGIETSMTELIHALLHAGPSDAAEARALLRSWRGALSDEL